MPELPEVETVCRGLREFAVGHVIEHVTLYRRAIRFPISEHFEAAIEQQNITEIRRRSKYILIQLQDGGQILCHLGMSGRLLFIKDKAYQPTKHDHAQFTLDNGASIIFNDVRRFGVLDYLAPGQTEHVLLDRIGLDPFSGWVTWQWLYEAFHKRRITVKDILMDQRGIAGLGNIYVSEALFRAGIWPERIANTLTKAEAKKLVPAIRAVLNDAIEAGGSSLRDYVQTDGTMGFFQDKFNVYGRHGKACIQCGAPIEKMTQAGRSTYACSTCQK